jgi:hypothetical protein
VTVVLAFPVTSRPAAAQYHYPYYLYYYAPYYYPYYSYWLAQVAVDRDWRPWCDWSAGWRGGGTAGAGTASRDALRRHRS